MDGEPVSRKAAKFAKFAKESKDFSLALLCAFAWAVSIFPHVENVGTYPPPASQGNGM
jgi:hypothetical protein